MKCGWRTFKQTSWLVILGAICAIASACTTSISGMNASSGNNQVVAPPVQLAFSAEPSSSAGAGVTFSVQPTVEIEDSNGNLVTSATNTVTLAAFSDSSCTTPAAGTFTVSNNNLAASLGVASFTGVNYGGTTTTIYIGASSSGLKSACSNAVTITPGNPAKLIFSTEPSSSGTAGVSFTTQPAITVEDSYGNVVTSATNSVKLAAYTNSACTSAGSGTFGASTNPLTPSSGVATFSGANYTKSGTFYIGASSSGLASACSNAISVVAGPPAKLIGLTGPANSVLVNGCYGTNIGVEDAYGNTATVSGSALTVNLNATSTNQKFYSDSVCTTSTTTATIAVGQSNTGSIYYSDSAVESDQWYASASGLTNSPSDNQAWDLDPVITFSASSFSAGTCVSFTVTAEDAKNTVMTVPNTSTFTLQNYGSRSTIFTTSGCSGVISASALSMPAGQSSVTYYFQDIRAESMTPNISGAGNLYWGGPSASVTVLAATSNTLSITGPTFETPGTCAGPYAVTTTDTYGNPSTVTGSALTVGLSTTGSAAIYAAAGCSTTTASVSIGVGSDSQTFYVEDSAPEVSTVTASPASFSYTASSFNFDSITTSPLQQVAVGGDFTCALISGGVKCWGDNTYGELGNGTTTSSLAPVSVSNLTSGVSKIVAAMASGTPSGFACALKSDNTIWCWGYGGDGELGNGGTSNSSTPVEVAISGTPLKATQISSEGDEICAITAGGALYCWGGGGSYMPSSSTPQLLSPGAISVADDGSHACVVETGGDLKCFGNNGYDDLGDGSPTVSDYPTSSPAQVYGLSSGVTSTAVATLASCAVASGAVECWSTVGYGEANSSLPAAVGAPLTSGVASVMGAASNSGFFALTTSGALYGWGDGGCCPAHNNHGLFANGTTTTSYNYSSPGEIISSGVQSASTTEGSDTACAIVSGNIECWGENQYGQVGTGTLDDKLNVTYPQSLE